MLNIFRRSKPSKKELERIFIEKLKSLPVFQIKVKSDTPASLIAPSERAMLKSQAKRDHKLCIDQDVCPECGEDLSMHEWSPSDLDYCCIKYCIPCQLRTEVEVDYWL